MSDILSKDRKPLATRLRVEQTAINLSSDIINIVNNESKFPRRKREIFGIRLIDHACSCAEAIKCANYIPLDINNYKNRRSLIFKAINNCNCLLSDLNILYSVINLPVSEKKFIITLVDTTENLLAGLNNWKNQNEKLFNVLIDKHTKIEAKDRSIKASERAERQLLAERRAIPGTIIPFIFVGENNMVIGDSACTDKQIIFATQNLNTKWKNT